MEKPLPINDRLAELERRQADLLRTVAALKPAGGRRVNSRETWAAITAEHSDAESESDLQYPRFATGDQHLLPFRFIEADVEPDLSEVEWTEQHDEPKTHAASRVWYPPGVLIEVAFDGRRWRVVRGPTLLHGVPGDGLSTASWEENCERYALGSGTVQIWQINESGKYVPQSYANGDPVTMTWRNVSTAVFEAFLTASLNAYGHWIVTVEPCDLTCTPEPSPSPSPGLLGYVVSGDPSPDCTVDDTGAPAGYDGGGHPIYTYVSNGSISCNLSYDGANWYLTAGLGWVWQGPTTSASPVGTYLPYTGSETGTVYVSE